MCAIANGLANQVHLDDRRSAPLPPDSDTNHDMPIGAAGAANPINLAPDLPPPMEIAPIPAPPPKPKPKAKRKTRGEIPTEEAGGDLAVANNVRRSGRARG
jgi:hypothetical protein